MTEDIRKIWEKIAAADEGTLKELANKGTYKRACKDTEGLSPEYEEGSGSITVKVGGETVNVVSDLAKCSCTCPSRAVCRHIIGGILLLRQAVPEDITVQEKQEEPRETNEAQTEDEHEDDAPVMTAVQIKTLSPKDNRRVRECVQLCKGLLDEILADGLMRISEDMPARLEAAAVRCHGVRAARAERAVRELGSRLSEHLERRAAFDGHMFSQKLCRLNRLLDTLDRDGLTEDDLGEFRRSYEALEQPLTLLPIGARDVTEGEYRGEVYYFLDVDGVSGQRFLTFSDLRPVFYENSRRRTPKTVPWDLGVPLDNFMKSKLVLKNAKVSGGKLSSSADTQVVSQTKMTLNCPDIYKLIVSDFRQIAAELECGTQTLFFIHPDKCIEHRFDKYEQMYIMTIEDMNGCRITVRAKYKAETGDFVTLLEKIGSKMVREPDIYYTLLAKAYIEEGELRLFPIEIYDHILPFEENTYELPEVYSGFDRDAYYADILLGLFSQIREMLYFIIHCGLRSDIRDEEKLVKAARNSGMAHLAKLTEELFSEASAYRHDVRGEPHNITEKIAQIYDYINTGEKKLGTISALAKMSVYCDTKGVLK